MASTTAEELRRRVDGWRAAERRERQARELEGPPAPSKAIEEALELATLDPLPAGAVDPARERNEELARAAWDRLKRGVGWQRSEPRR